MAKLIPITIPKWGIEMERGTISQWRVSPGEAVTKGDELVDIETDKIVNSFEASSDGVLVRIIADEGDELEVGALIGVMATESVPDDEIDAFIAASGEKQEPASGAQPAQELPAQSASPGSSPAASGGAAVTGGGEAKVSPALRRKAERMSVDLSSIAGTGYAGRILRDDIEAAASNSQDGSLFQLQGAQKVIAERMTLAKQNIPHFYLNRDVEMANVKAMLQSERDRSGTAMTVNHAIVYAVARTLQQHPELNVNVLPGGIRQLESVDVAIAVDTGESLLTPVVKDIGEASLSSVAAGAKEIVERTRDKQLTSSDLEGAAITVSNLGMFGVSSFTAIINPPQVMILAVGALQERVVLREGQPELSQFCSLSLACDHRVVNGAAGARFLAGICELLEADPH